MKRNMPSRPASLHKALRLALCVALAGAGLASARQGELPYSLAHPAISAAVVPIEDLAPIDAARRRAETDTRAPSAAAPTKRLATSDVVDVSIDSSRHGIWQLLPDGSRLWRVTVRASGATDLRFGFSRFDLPSDAALYVIGADSYYQGPYTAADARDGRFQSSIVPGDAATIELRIPAGIARSNFIEIATVGRGFRDLFKRALDTGLGTSGPCNVNVVCPLGQPYPDDIRAIGYYEFVDDVEHGTFICTGTLLADVPHDRRNFFLTAAHCISRQTEADSMVVYWNYQSTTCSGLSPPGGGFLNVDQHGATLRA